MKSIRDFGEMKHLNEKITMVTCYDYWSAQIIDTTSIDCILVGDSVAMVMHGHDTTIPASIEMMSVHIQAVARGAKQKFIVGDMPFLSYRKGFVETMNAVEVLMRAGANAVKLEGVYGHEESIRQIAQSGVPVMGHVGMTPQSIHQLGGFKVQGKGAVVAKQIMAQAKLCEELGCFAVVLECVPSDLAQTITESLSIPTIGIGAGPHTSGQVLVLHDLLGFNDAFKPKFLKTYLNGSELLQSSLNAYDAEVKAGVFPNAEIHCY